MVPEIFKYNSVLSIPLFSVVALFLIRRTPNFSFSKHTVSKTVLFLNHSTHALIFRLNFVIKGILDLGFVWYLIRCYNLSFNSPLSWCLTLSAFLFGLLAYFVEGAHTRMHRIVAYSSGVLWAISEVYLALLTDDAFFIQLTAVSVAVVVCLTFGFKFAKKTNVFVQAFCMIVWYMWLILFVFRYL
jgi:hypothetical protein